MSLPLPRVVMVGSVEEPVLVALASNCAGEGVADAVAAKAAIAKAPVVFMLLVLLLADMVCVVPQISQAGTQILCKKQ